MSVSDKDRYFAEMAQLALGLGADPVPTTLYGAYQFIVDTRSLLRYDARTRNVSRLILSQPMRNPFALPLQNITMQAAIDLLPVWARQMHGLELPILARPLIRAGTFGVAETLRWTFR